MESASTIETVSNFLKSKGCRFSAGSWKDLFKLRVLPAVEDGKVTEAELDVLLAEAEEHGHQHVFLYKTTKDNAAALLDRAHVQRWAKAQGLTVGPATMVDLPESKAVGSVRYYSANDLTGLIVQVVEKRIYREYKGDKTIGSMYIKRWRITEERAINVVRLRPDGLLDLRVRSHLNSTKYGDDVGAFWTLLQGLFARSAFATVSLQKSKDKIFSNKESLATEIAFNDSTQINDAGTRLLVTAGSGQEDLFQDEAAVEAVDKFAESEGAMSESSSIVWREQKSGPPSRDVRVLLSGEPNEFALPAACVRRDYEYVLERLLTHGSK